MNQTLELRRNFGQFATGVTIAACINPQGLPVGFTANSFSSLSLSPPLLQLAIDHESRLHDAMVEAEFFSVSILGRDQQAIADRFAASDTPRFNHANSKDGIDPVFGEYGLPFIEGALVWFACKRYQVITLGDHSLLVGEITNHHAINKDTPPLIYWGGRYQ